MEAKILCEPNGICRMRFDRAAFPWRFAVCAAMGDHQPESLHRFGALDVGGSHHERLQGTPWHRAYYARFRELADPLYRDFLRWLAEEHGIPAGELVYQKLPTLRIHVPGSTAVGEWHRDRDYGHATGEVNFWLPITDAFGTQGLWIEGCHQDAVYGELIVFDGVNLEHGNAVNATNQTRVSIDFRLALRSTFKPSGERSKSAGVKFDIGPSYFEVL